MSTLRHLSPAKRVAVAAALLGVLVATAGLALASPSVPAPTITSQPGNPTASSTASFSFTATQKSVTFACSLDGAALITCASPKAYSGLTDGTHTFAVVAKLGGSTSSATTYTWRVDLLPPTTTITFPVSGKAYNLAGWNAGCPSGAGLCGGARDPSGVSAVTVSIRNNSSGKFWSGTGFTATSETYLTASLSAARATTTSWSYRLSPPSTDGSYTVHARATDTLGNQTPIGSPTASTFTVDTTPPPAPALSASETSPTGSTSITLTFSDAEARDAFQCKLDSGAFSGCTSPVSYSGLSVASHTFTVQAVDAAGNTAAGSFGWQIVKVVPFGIAGSVPNPIYPGAAAQPIPLSLANSMTVPITVTGLTVAVGSTGVSACNPGWFAVTQSNLSSILTLRVPAGTSAFPVPSASLPTLRMIDSGTKQDACKGAKLTLTYSGSAHS